jgi:uncharacterized protein YdeI (YjbR/CyaY-like superfamily)
MGARDKRIDNYIMNASEYAWPILDHLRELVHKACPQVEETIKWSFPHFQYKGILCSMAAFKHHCAFGFWKTSLMKDPYRVMNVNGKTAMGSLGKITSLKDLPSNRILLEYIKEAMKLNEEAVMPPAQKKLKSPAKLLKVPDDLLKALKSNLIAMETFKGFSTSKKNEYIHWITEAKTEATRTKRLISAITWMEEGKSRDWRYLKSR